MDVFQLPVLRKGPPFLHRGVLFEVPAASFGATPASFSNVASMEKVNSTCDGLQLAFVLEHLIITVQPVMFGRVKSRDQRFWYDRLKREKTRC